MFYQSQSLPHTGDTLLGKNGKLIEQGGGHKTSLNNRTFRKTPTRFQNLSCKAFRRIYTVSHCTVLVPSLVPSLFTSMTILDFSSFLSGSGILVMIVI